MRIVVNGTAYEFVIFSDLMRDGLGMECLSEREEELLCECFWFDETDRMSFIAHRAELPVEVVAKLLELARRKLPPEKRRGFGRNWQEEDRQEGQG